MTPPEPRKAEGATFEMDEPTKDGFVAQDEQTDNRKMLVEKDSHEKLSIILLIVGTGLIAYHFW